MSHTIVKLWRRKVATEATDWVQIEFYVLGALSRMMEGNIVVESLLGKSAA